MQEIGNRLWVSPPTTLREERLFALDKICEAHGCQQLEVELLEELFMARATLQAASDLKMEGVLHAMKDYLGLTFSLSQGFRDRCLDMLGICRNCEGTGLLPYQLSPGQTWTGNGPPRTICGRCGGSGKVKGNVR